MGAHYIPSQVFDVTPTLDPGVAYADGDLLFDTIEVPNAFLGPIDVAHFYSVYVLDEDDQGAAFDLYFLNAGQTMGSANSAPNISDANARKILGGPFAVAAANYADIGGAKCGRVNFDPFPLKSAGIATSTSIWVAGVSRGTGTYTVNGLKLKLGFRY